METSLMLIVGIAVGLFVGFLIAKLYFLQHVRAHRQQAVSQSRSTTLGYVSEAIAPLLPNFPYHYKDMVFLGKGVDYIVFDGLNVGDLRQIIFLEIKTNTSQLNARERMIKNSLNNGHVRYEVLRLSRGT